MATQLDFFDPQSLVEETFDETEKHGHRDPFSQQGQRSFKDVCGLFYRIEKSSQTFHIRALATKNAHQEMQDQQSQVWKNLRLEGVDEDHQVKFFETKHFELAQSIVGKLAHTRFPLKESLVCNLSDPGFTWWLERKDNSYIIYLQYPALYENDLCSLGPLGDRNLLFFYGDRLKNVEVEQKAVSLEFMWAQETEEVRHLKALWDQGEGFPMDYFDKKEEAFFWQELAGMREFWLAIQNELNLLP